MKYNLWDEIVLKVEDMFDYDDKYFSRLKVTVIGYSADNDSDYVQYLCYIPPYETIPFKFPTFTINRDHHRLLGVDAKFIGDTGCFITANQEIYKHVPAPKGERCSNCKEWIHGAESDWGNFKCTHCRENPWR